MDLPQDIFVDIHTHILPGIDDGPEDMSESLAMARKFVESGVNRIVATPHYIPGTAWSAGKEQIIDEVSGLKEQLASKTIELEVMAGMEIAYHKRMPENIRDRKLLSLGDSDHYLIEPSFHGSQDNLLMMLHDLLLEGEKPILAHPERVAAFQEKPESLAKLVSNGLKVQVTGNSLLGLFGSRSKNTAELFVKNGWLDFIASDAHDAIKRPPLQLQDWQKLLVISLGEKLIERVMKNSSELFK